MAKVMELARDQLLFSEGEAGREMYIIMEGKVQVFLLREQFQVILANLEKGHFFGEMSLLEGEPRSAGVLAIEPTKLLVIDQANFQNFISQNPSLAVKVMKGLSQRVRKGNEEIFTLKHELAQLREAVPAGAVPAQSEIELETDSEIKPEIKPDFEPEIKAEISHISPPVPGNETALPDEMIKEQQKIPPKLIEAWKQSMLQIADEEKLTCPVCQNRFARLTLKKVNLKLVKKDYWFREYYEGIEPLWFKHTCCPGCYFAAPQDIFSEVGRQEAERLKSEVELRKKAVTLAAPPPMVSAGQAMGFYRLTLLSLGDKEEYLNQLAENSLELSWLYREAGDRVREQETLHQSFQYLKAIVVKEGMGNAGVLQKSLYWQGLISLRLNNTAEGSKLIREAIKVAGMEKSIIYVMAKKIEEKLANLLPLNI